MRSVLFSTIFSIVSYCIYAQAPAGYYSSADGLEGYALKTELHNIIDNHTDRGYSALWDLYYTSDDKPNGKVWDMYSDQPGGTPAYEFTFGSDQCGSYAAEGDCYNREHSFPRSWFNDGLPMENDPFHVIPSDGYVNGRRGNYAYGEVASPTHTSTNGSKVGPNTRAGYSGTVFEPIDEYKGDLARGYFYMATRYEDVISGWENYNSNGDAMLDGSANKVFETWALEMLIDWHESDPVSQKEIDRNEAIYNFQGNRNPFIDHPEWVGCIWGASCTTTPTPGVSIIESLNDFGIVAFGNSSAVQSYQVAGSNLNDAIIVTASDNFEVSLVNSSEQFSSSVSLIPTSGTVSTTTIYVRFTPISDSNAEVGGTLIHESTGATTQSISVTGTEENTTGTPTISVSENLTDFGIVEFGNASTSQSYEVSGSDLSGELTVTASTGFEVALVDSDSEFSQSISLNPDNGVIANTMIYVRFKPTANSNSVVSGTIEHTSSGATTQTINVSGTEADETVVPSVSFSGNAVTIDPIDNYTVKINLSNVSASGGNIFLEVTSTLNLVYGDSGFITEPASENGVITVPYTDQQTSVNLDLNFGSSVYATVTKKLTFSILEDASYDLGSNSSFELTINPSEEEVVTGIEYTKKEVVFYPNPVSDKLVVKNTQNFDMIVIYSQQGQKVFSSQPVESIDVSQWNDGIYYMLLYKNKQYTTYRIAIN